MAEESIQTPAPSTYRQAFEQIKDEIMAISEQEFLHVSLDIAAAVITTQGVYPEVAVLREHFVQHLPTFDIAKVDKLETYALAMFCAQADYKAALEPPASLTDLVANAVATRGVLLADVNALIARGLLAPNVVDGLQGTNGHKNVMMDLGTLASILRKHAAKISERTSVKPDELAAAEDLANRLGKAVGLREQSPQAIAQTARVRQAAFTLFVRTYDDVRCAVQYLRRAERDADSIVPSLYTSRGFRRKVAEEKAEETLPPVTEVSANTTTGNTASSKGEASEPGPFMQ